MSPPKNSFPLDFYSVSKKWQIVYDDIKIRKTYSK